MMNLTCMKVSKSSSKAFTNNLLLVILNILGSRHMQYVHFLLFYWHPRKFFFQKGFFVFWKTMRLFHQHHQPLLVVSNSLTFLRPVGSKRQSRALWRRERSKKTYFHSFLRPVGGKKTFFRMSLSPTTLLPSCP